MRGLRLLLITAVALTLPAFVAAQPAEEEVAEDFGRPGPYVGGGFVWGFENFNLDEVNQVSGVDVSASGSPGMDIRGGYRFTEYFALEGNIDYYGGFDIDAPRFDDVSLYAFSFFASAKAFALSGRVQPYGLFGLGVLAAQTYDDEYYYYDYGDSDASFAIRAGAGLDVYITPKFLLNLDAAYVIPTNEMNFGGPAGVGMYIVPLAITGQYRF